MLLRVASLNIAHGRGDALNQMLIGQGEIEGNLDAAGALMTKTDTHVVALQWSALTLQDDVPRMLRGLAEAQVLAALRAWSPPVASDTPSTPKARPLRSCS